MASGRFTDHDSAEEWLGEDHLDGPGQQIIYELEQEQEYMGRTMIQTVPTKLEDGPTDHSQAVHDGGRPSSAGSNSTALETNGEVAHLAASPRGGGHEAAGTLPSGVQLFRLELSEEGPPNQTSTYRYGNAAHPAMDFTGTRRAPSGTIRPPYQDGHEPAAPHGEQAVMQDTSNTVVLSDTDAAQAVTAPAAVNSHTSRPRHSIRRHGYAPSASGKVSKRSKKSKKPPKISALIPQGITGVQLGPNIFNAALRAHASRQHYGTAFIRHQNDVTQARRQNHGTCFVQTQVDVVPEEVQPATPPPTAEEAQHPAEQAVAHYEQLRYDTDGVEEVQPYPEQAVTADNFLAVDESIRGPSVVPLSPPPQRTLRSPTEHGGLDTAAATAGGVAEPRHPPPQKKAKRQSSEASAAVSLAVSSGSDLDLTDVLLRAARKAKDDQQQTELRINAMKADFEEKLRLATEERKKLMTELANLENHSDWQKGEVEKQAKHVGRVKELTKFVNGMAKDVTGMESRLSHARRECTEVIAEARAKDATLAELRKCAQNASHTSREALDAFYQLQRQLSAVQKEKEDIQKKLNDTAGMLGEERNRCAKLDLQLSHALDADAKALRALNRKTGDVVDMLSIMAAEQEERYQDKTAIELLQQTLAEIQDAKIGCKDAVNTVDSISSLVETLSESVTEHFEAVNSAITSAQSQQDNISKAAFDEALNELKQHLIQNKDFYQQEARHQEAMARVEDQRKACELRKDELSSQLSVARRSESELREQNANLQQKLAVLSAQPQSSDDAGGQREALRNELDSTAKALQMSKVDVAAKSEELSVLADTHANLQEQMAQLQQELEWVNQQATTAERDRDETTSKSEKAEQQIRQEMREHIERLELDLRAETRNEIKKLSSENTRLLEQVNLLNNSLENVNARAQHQENELSNNAEAKHQLSLARKESEIQQTKIESLQSSLADLQLALKEHQAVKAQLADLSAKYTESQTSLQDLVDKKEEADGHVSKLRTELSEAKAAEANVRSALERIRIDHDAALRAKDDDIEKGLLRYKASCNEEFALVKQEHERKVRALQNILATAEQERDDARQSVRDSKAEDEERWKEEQTKHGEVVSQLRQQIRAVEAARDEAIQARVEKETSMEAQRVASEQRVTQLQQRAQTAETSVTDTMAKLAEAESKLADANTRLADADARLADTEARLADAEASVLAIEQDRRTRTVSITPAGGSKSAAPQRPRKKVDRTTNTVVEVGTIPQPEHIRPDSQRSVLAVAVEPTEFMYNPFAGKTPQPRGGADDASSRSDIEDILTIKEPAVASLSVVNDTQESGSDEMLTMEDQVALLTEVEESQVTETATEGQHEQKLTSADDSQRSGTDEFFTARTQLRNNLPGLVEETQFADLPDFPDLHELSAVHGVNPALLTNDAANVARPPEQSKDSQLLSVFGDDDAQRNQVSCIPQVHQPLASSHIVRNDSRGYQGPLPAEQRRQQDSSRTLDDDSQVFRRPSNVSNRHPPESSHTIGNDSLTARGPSHAVLHEQRRHNLYESQAEADKYAYQKPTPAPNSASKRAKRSESFSTAPESAHPASVRPNFGGRTSNHTPLPSEYRGHGADNDVHSSHSSSPGFMSASQTTRRKQSTYALVGSGSQRKISSSASKAADPRLVPRSQPATQKRKAESTITSGYEQERKKRMASQHVGSDATHPSSQTSQSNAFQTMPTGPRGSLQYGSSSRRGAPPMRNLGVSNSRPQRGGKKASSNDAYSERFAKELQGR